MKQEKKGQEPAGSFRSRREYAKKGERSQTMMSFRVDNECLDWLQRQPNKGRAINNLILDAIKRGVG